MSKNIKKYSNIHLTNILSPKIPSKQYSNVSPFNVNKVISSKNNIENMNKGIKKENSSKPNKKKRKNSEIILKNYLSQRTRLNTEENELNLNQLKFSYNFLRNKIDNTFKSKDNKNNSKKINQKQSNLENNNNNFRTAKKLNYSKNRIVNNKNINTDFTKLRGNNYKKIIYDNSNNYELYKTNIKHNRSNTQVFSQKSSEKIRNKTENNSKQYKKMNKSEDMKRRNILKDNKSNINFSGILKQISPLYASNKKLSNIQNYFRNISNKKQKIKNKSKGKRSNKERQILITEQREHNKSKNIDTNEFLLKENSSYLLISKKPTQITNFIEKKENNKYINNYFNICENNKNSENNQNITFEEIHFFFVKQIQAGNKLKNYMNFHQN